MQMSDVVEVVQVAGAANANKKLTEGWKLLAVTGAGNGQEEGRTFVWYVLGKPAEKKGASGLAGLTIRELQDQEKAEGR